MSKAEQTAKEIYKDGIELLGRRDKNGNLIIHPETMVGILRNACRRGYEQAERDLGWISVFDRLPAPSEWVVVCIEDYGHAQCLTLAVYSEETKEWHTDQWEDGEQETYNPDYWMPIPNIIKEAKK